jgi:hypothetical protein
MATIHVGEIWTLSLADKPCDVSVVAATGSPGWWRCIDLETGIAFVASERWFVGLVSLLRAHVDCDQLDSIGAT